MNVVIDASVVLKWVLQADVAELDIAAAFAILRAVEDGNITVRQPPHWLVEVLGVLARRDGPRAAAALTDLRRLPFLIVDDDRTILRACELASRLKQHLFDTFYHAVALQYDAVLVTADDKYFAAARGESRIERLTNFSIQRGA